MILSVLIRALKEEKTATVSGFGTFSVKNIPSQIKEDIIYPPHNIIEFAFNKEIEDFSFISKLSQWEQIRIDEAHAKITEWVNLIENGLEHNKSVFFDDFGTFSKDTTGKIVFQGMVNSQINIENEGFEPVLIPQRKENKKHRNMAAPMKDKRIILHKRKKKREMFLFILIIIIVLGLLSLLFLRDMFNTGYQMIKRNIKTVVVNNKVEDENVIYISKIAEEEIVDVVNPLDKGSAIDTASTAIEISVNKNKTNTLISLAAFQELYLPYHKGYYYLIAGSFVKEESALLHIKQKKLDKFHAKLIVHPDSPRIRVCIGVFDNEEEAIHIAVQLDKNYWVLK